MYVYECRLCHGAPVEVRGQLFEVVLFFHLKTNHVFKYMCTRGKRERQNECGRHAHVKVREHPQMLLHTFPNCLGQGLLFAGSGSYARLAGTQASRGSRVSTTSLAIGMLGLQMLPHLALCGCREGVQTQVLLLSQEQVLNPLSHLRGSIVLRMVSVAMINTTTKESNLGRKGFIWLLFHITVHHQRQSGQEP